MPRKLYLSIGLALACVVGQNSAIAQNLPNQTQSVILLNIIAAKGAECGLLRPWEAAIVQSLAEQDTLRWEDARKAEAASETQTRLAETNCETPVIVTWIEGARRGIATEYLSLYLVVYSTLLQMEAPPQIFGELAQRDTAEADIATIDAAIAEMEASGARPDGGGAWPQFVERTGQAVREFAPMLDAGEAPADVNFLMPRAIAITELWLAEQSPIDAPQ